MATHALRVLGRLAVSLSVSGTMPFAVACNAILDNEPGYPTTEPTSGATSDDGATADASGFAHDAATTAHDAGAGVTTGDATAHDAGVATVPDARAPVDASPPVLDAALDSAPAGSCGPALTLCKASCVDLLNDPKNCGSCDAKCHGKALCTGGVCGP